MKVNISNMPMAPSDLKLTAHGYMKITSTSNKTNNIATRKYLMENGDLALPICSIPHSKESAFTFDLCFGPSHCVTIITKETKPAATINISKMGRKSLELFKDCKRIIVVDLDGMGSLKLNMPTGAQK